MLFIQEGKDYEDVDEANLPYTLLRNLGHGHSGNVEAVRDEVTKAVFARKTIYTPPSRLAKQERMKVFRNEVKIIRALGKHRHIVSVFATYVTKRHFGLILQPVASDGDLEDFLNEYWSLVGEIKDKTVHSPCLENMVPVLKRAFGCLAVGMAFMHNRKVRHKDIKPRNILIHKGLVLYTDFGYSFDSNSLGRSTTEGKPSFLTRKYSAPEVLEYEKRNSKSDVFSLGCVFIDLLFALTFMHDTEQEIKNYSESMDDIHKTFESIEFPSSVHFFSSLLKTTMEMTMRDDTVRLCAFHAASKVLSLLGLSCPECQSTSIEAWSPVYHEDSSGKNYESTKKEQDQKSKRCCIAGHHYEPTPALKTQSQEFHQYEGSTSREPMLTEAISDKSTSRPYRNFWRASELSNLKPFVIDMYGFVEDMSGNMLEYLEWWH